MSSHGKLPRWLGLANRTILFLHRIGLPIGPPHILTVRGRRTGQLRSTPVSIVTVDGDRYIVGSPDAAWVKNVRAAGRAEMSRGRRSKTIQLAEVPPEQRGRVLRTYWHQHPQGRPITANLLGLNGDATADDFEAVAPGCPVFRLDLVPVVRPPA